MLLETTLITHDFLECTLTMCSHKILGMGGLMRPWKLWSFQGQQHMNGKSQISEESIVIFVGVFLLVLIYKIITNASYDRIEGDKM